MRLNGTSESFLSRSKMVMFKSVVRGVVGRIRSPGLEQHRHVGKLVGQRTEDDLGRDDVCLAASRLSSRLVLV